jgi:Holliday junction DNA helicase RuvA
MIASLYGTLEAITEDFLVVQVGGVGLQVYVPATLHKSLGGIGSQVALHTYLVVRENALALYGFAEEEERTLFEMLLGVPGIGPRMALAVLSTLSMELISNAIARDEPEVLTRVPGVGKKTAQKLVFELKGRLAPEMLPAGLAAISDVDTEVIAALTALGYSIVEAQAALQAIPDDTPDDVEERVLAALAYFAT